MRINVIGSGVFIPEQVLSNNELVESYNAQLEAGDVTDNKSRLANAEFIAKASGIHQRRVLNKKGILDNKTMRPIFHNRSDDEISIQAEIAIAASEEALKAAEIDPSSLDLVIVAATSLERAYPAVAIEVQNAIGANGRAFDMSVACSSATFAFQTAYEALLAGSATRALIICPEIATAQVDYTDRTSHFIFGDGAAALILERDTISKNSYFEILGVKSKTKYSNAIRNNFGFLNRCSELSETEEKSAENYLFKQQGPKVFREIVPFASKHISSHLADLEISTDSVHRVWFHQANSNINRLVFHRVFGHPPEKAQAPMILSEFGNLASAGSIVSFHLHHKNMPKGSIGILSSFGAGYSVSNIVLKKVN